MPDPSTKLSAEERDLLVRGIDAWFGPASREGGMLEKVFARLDTLELVAKAARTHAKRRNLRHGSLYDALRAAGYLQSETARGED